MRRQHPPYTKWQLNLIRIEIKNVYDFKSDTEGCSWDTLARKIDTFFKNLSKADRGFIPKDFQNINYIGFEDSNSTRPGNKLALFADRKRYSIDDLHLIATAMFLIHGGSSASRLTPEILLSLPKSENTALALANYLGNVEFGCSFCSVDKVQGVYKRSNQIDFPELRAEFLHLTHIVNDNVISIQIMRTTKVEFEDDEGVFFSEERKITHNGWLILAPYERIYCLLHNVDNTESKVIQAIGLDERIYDEGLSSVLFIDSELVFFDETMVNSAEGINLWIKANCKNTFLFQRVN